MGLFRLATYNVEWFNALFDDENELHIDGGWSARWNITRAAQTQALTQVFRALDADAVMIIEAPDTSPRTSQGRDCVRALENFATYAGIRARRAVTGFTNNTQQEIALLYDPDRCTARHDPSAAPHAPRFDGAWQMDLDFDDYDDLVQWSKPPLELALSVSDAAPLRVIGVHAKSKAAHGASGQDAQMRLAIANRRKQLAQCIWLRRRVVHHLEQGERVIVLGDFNDGPGLDEYERLFGRSSVEIVLGEKGAPLYDPHAALALSQRLGAAVSTARFFDRDAGRYYNALLDYIMVSSDIRSAGATWRVWHPFDDAACWRDTELSDALLTASDHFPVTLEFPV